MAQIRRRIVALAAGLALATIGADRGAVAQQEPTGRSKLTEQLNKVLTDPAEMEKLEKEKNRAPIEFFKSYAMPNDVIPYVKANHWSTLAVELRSNQINYTGTLETQPVALRDMPQEVVFRRDAGLVKGQRSRLLFQLMTPAVPREILLRLMRPESLRDDETYAAALRVLEPHQMLIPVLTKGANDAYGRWNQMRMMFPLSGLKGDAQVYDRQRYYRMVLPGDTARPELPTHPLTWTTISHVIWDGMSPETLSVSQQEAMLDWLHWGGQLILVGGAGPSFAPLRESFLGPYLPAEPSGQSAQLGATDLATFAKAYPPLAPASEPDEPIEATQTYTSAFEEVGKRYKPPAPLLIPRDKPLYVATLTPKPGARVIGFEKPGLPPLGVEWRVGRGRVLMLGASITDPSLLAWPGLDTMIRRVVLRRPEDPLAEELRYNTNGIGGYLPPRYESLAGPDLTWYRLFSRDLGAPTRRVRIDDSALEETEPPAAPRSIGAITLPSTPVATVPAITPAGLANVYSPFQVPVAEWLDSAAIPSKSREALEKASGIEIPGRRFVLMVIVAYVVLLVPVNWLVCRFALGRREWAWVLVPVLAIGFAILVERAAAFDVGYESSCTEIDVMETFGDYPRGHLSRFASLYTTGRVKYAISYPSDPTTLALPLNRGRSIRGEDVQQSVFTAYPNPTLSGFQVQPRSLAMFRAEGLASLPGTVTLSEEGGARHVVNNTGAELRDAVVVEMGAGTSQVFPLGTIAPKARVEIKGEGGAIADYKASAPPDLKKNQVDPSTFMSLLVRSSAASRPEDEGEVRLLAWLPSPQAGQTIDPPVDVHQGFTLVVAHLKLGPTPDPASARFNILAHGPESPSNRMLFATPPPPVYNRNMMGRGAPVTTVAPRRFQAPPPALGVPPVPATPGEPGQTPDDTKPDEDKPSGPRDRNAPETDRP